MTQPVDDPVGAILGDDLDQMASTFARMTRSLTTYVNEHRRLIAERDNAHANSCELITEVTVLRMQRDLYRAALEEIRYLADTGNRVTRDNGSKWVLFPADDVDRALKEAEGPQ